MQKKPMLNLPFMMLFLQFEKKCDYLVSARRKILVFYFYFTSPKGYFEIITIFAMYFQT
jgi:hypothetical protein